MNYISFLSTKHFRYVKKRPGIFVILFLMKPHGTNKTFVNENRLSSHNKKHSFIALRLLKYPLANGPNQNLCSTFALVTVALVGNVAN